VDSDDRFEAGSGILNEMQRLMLIEFRVVENAHGDGLADSGVAPMISG
jgi:hypothetical protein